MSRNDHLIDRLRSGSIDRRHLVGGAAGIATAATAAVALGSLVSAQSSGSTTATPEAGSGGSSSAGSAQDATAITDRSATIIASVKADRDALAASLDTATIDELLSLATDLQTKAEAAPVATGSGRRTGGGSSSSSGSSSSATPAAGTSTADNTLSKQALALAAVRTALAARETIVAQLANFGLPSEQARVSRVLAAIYDGVKSVATEAGSASVDDASTLVTHAEAAYQSAFEAYNAKTYARATAYGDASAHLAEAAAVLLGMRGSGRFGGRGRDGGSRGGMFRGESGNEVKGSSDATPESSSGSGTEPESSDDRSTPVTVPEPTF